MNYKIENKYYTCKYDRPFKEVFLKEKNKKLLKKLLKLVVSPNIKQVIIKPNERNTKNIKIRRKIYDALLETDIGKIEIEVNAGVDKYLYPRNTAFICDLYSHHTLVGEEYSEDIMIMQINFTYGKGKNAKPIEEYKIQTKEGKELVKNFCIKEINMDYFMSLWYDYEKKGINKNLIDENILIIMQGLEREELEKLSKEYEEVREYMKELDKINSDPEFREYMTYEEDQRKIFNTKMRESKEEGISEGITQGIIQTAKEMLKEKFPIEQISKITKLSLEEIEKLK